MCCCGTGMTVLELGSGCGPVGITAGILGTTPPPPRHLKACAVVGRDDLNHGHAGAHVIATDVEWILTFTKKNAELNRKLIEEGGGSVECRTLYWYTTLLVNIS
jgi:hypothetical protein